MNEREHPDKASCRAEVGVYSRSKERLPVIVDSILRGCAKERRHAHLDYRQIPSSAAVIEMLQMLRGVIFPGYFAGERVDSVNLGYYIGETVDKVFEILSEQITRSLRHECFMRDRPCSDCVERGYEYALAFLESIPALQRILETDVMAAYEGDPAAKSFDEIILSYPGLFAIMAYRMAHRLHTLSVPLLPRMITEYVHGKTGIDIHPGAKIGERFMIDHGTGVVIGETSKIGKNVRIYQGVTIGALSVPKGEIEAMRGRKRHPTIEDDVIIYSGASILGGDTVIGARSVIGGNVWITESVPPDTTVVLEAQQLGYRRYSPKA